MKVIILAAGQGTRLRPLTDDRPKCMVEVNGKPIVKHQIDLFKELGVEDINIVAGYRQDNIQYNEVKKFINPKFDSTNMVYTLFCADDIIDDSDDIIISYGDIIYRKDVLDSLMKSDADISVVVDKNWKEYWSARMDNPLDDVETLKIGPEGNNIELGKKPSSYNDIEGQYIGLIKFKRNIINKVKDYYRGLDKASNYDGKDYNNMYMTTFLQLIADNILKLEPVYISNGWMEVDCAEDIKHTNQVF